MDDDRLDGWGEMTAHAKVDRKTYLNRGYPVHYELTGRVYALRSELDAARGIPANSQELPQTPIAHNP